MFTIEKAKKRDDWFKIPEIASAYRDLRDALSRRDNNGATAAFEAFKVACLLSDDLINEDAQTLVDKIKKQMAVVLPATSTETRSDQAALNLPPLEEIDLYTKG